MRGRALWPVEPPALVDTALNALLSKLRKAMGSDCIDGRGEVRLVAGMRGSTQRPPRSRFTAPKPP